MPISDPLYQELAVLMALFADGGYEQAVVLALRLTERFPLDGICWKFLGATLKQLGRNTDALAAMRRAMALLPNDPEAHGNLGVVYKGLGLLDKAESSYRRALLLEPDFADAHNNLGNTLKDLGRLCEAEACYLHTVRLRPLNAQAYNSLGNILYDLVRLDEAAMRYRQAIAINCGFAEAHYNLGNTCQRLGFFEESLGCYRHALRIKPDLAEASQALGNAYKRLGELTEAENSFREALKIRPSYAEVHSNLGNVLRGLDRLDQAETSCRRAIEIKPEFSGSYCNLGVILHDLGRHAEAELNYLRALQITSGIISEVSQLAAHNFGISLNERGLQREAVSYFQQAYAERTGFPQTQDGDLASGVSQAFIEITNKCNFHCDFCPSDLQHRKQRFMGLALIQQLYDEVAKTNLVSQVSLHLMGEPTLHPDLIQILEHAASRRVSTELVTNGSTLTPKTVPRILEALSGTLAISLQIPSEATFPHRGQTGLSWNRYIDNIRLLAREHLKRVSLGQALNCTLEIRVMITRDSKLGAKVLESQEDMLVVLREWSDFVNKTEIELGMLPYHRESNPETRLCETPGAINIRFPLQRGLSLLFWQGSAFANSMLGGEYLLKLANTASYCSHPFLDVAVLSSGEVTLCCLDYDGSLAVGNVNDRPISEILRGKPAMALRAAMLGRGPLPAFCRKCQADVVPRPAEKY